MVLYSEKGLQIYERITQTKAYYPFEAEKEILEKYGDEIASRIFVSLMILSLMFVHFDLIGL